MFWISTCFRAAVVAVFSLFTSQIDWLDRWESLLSWIFLFPFHQQPEPHPQPQPPQWLQDRLESLPSPPPAAGMQCSRGSLWLRRAVFLTTLLWLLQEPPSYPRSFTGAAVLAVFELLWRAYFTLWPALNPNSLSHEQKVQRLQNTVSFRSFIFLRLFPSKLPETQVLTFVCLTVLSSVRSSGDSWMPSSDRSAF